MLTSVAAGLRRVGRGVPTFLRDVAGLIGIASIAYGAWMILPAAGFIVGGVFLLTGAILLSAKA